MIRTRLHVMECQTAGPRLCDTCASGVVLRSAAAPEDEVFCLFMARCVASDVIRCNRYAERDCGPGAMSQVYENAWVA